MATEMLAPVSSPSGVDRFLTSTLTAIKPNETTAPASANEKQTATEKGESSTKKETTTVSSTEHTASADSASTASPAPSGEEKKTDAQPPEWAAIQKQLGEQTRANKKLGKSNIELLQKNKELANELKELRVKLDPSYQPPAGPTPEQERALIEFQARESTSRKVAEEKYGAEAVQAKIYAEDSPYRQLISDHPWVHQRVLGSDNPVLEIFQVLDEFEVFTTYGRSPGAVLENVEKNVKDKLWKQWNAQAKGTPEQTTGKAVATLGETRGDTGSTATRAAPAFDLSSFNRYIP